MTKKEFLEVCERCKKEEIGIIVMVSIPGNKFCEGITNSYEDIENKEKYYDETYDENMNHKKAKDIRIVHAVPFPVHAYTEEEIKKLYK